MTCTRNTCRPRNCPSASRCSPAKKRSRNPGIGSKGHFPGPLFLALPPLEIEWHYRIQMAEKAAPDGDAGYPDLMRVAREHAIRADLRDVQIRHHRRASRRAFRHRRLADLADHRLRVGRHRHPARRRGDPARRMRSCARARRRRLADSGIAGPLLAAVGAVDPERSAGAGLQAVLQEPRRLRAGGRRRRPGARRLRLRASRAARKVLGILEGCGEKSDSFHRTRSSPDGKPIIACMRNALADAGVGPRGRRLHQRPRHLDAGERQDGMPRRLDRVRRAHPQHPDLLQQIDDRPHPDRGRRGRGGVHPADAANTSASRRPSITAFPIRRSRSTWCRTWRATPKSRAPSPIRSASAARTSRWCWRGSRRDAARRLPSTSDRARRPARTMRALTLVADRKIELLEVPAPPAPGRRRSADRHQGDRAQPHRRLGLARHGVRQAQAAAHRRRRGRRRDRRGRRRT